MSSIPRGDQAATIAAALRADILSGLYAPGSALGQDMIARRFAVSRIPVREALKRLEHDGLVRITPNASARVAPLRITDLAELSDMRIAAETLALRRAVPNLSNVQIDAAEALQDQIEAAQTADFAPLNAAFHAALYAASDRPRLIAHIGALNLLSERYLRRTVEQLNYSWKSHEQHRNILAACRARDAGKAETALRDHIENAVSALIAALRDGGIDD